MPIISASSSDDNRCCWLDLLLCPSSIILLHKIQFIIVHQHQPIDVLKCFGRVGSLPFMPIKLSGISIDICICKFLCGGHAGRRKEELQRLVCKSSCLPTATMLKGFFKQETVGCCFVDDPDLWCLWWRANGKGMMISARAQK